MAKKLKVINLFAGAGAGKSTTAAGLFFAMKTKNMSVELVTEYAKDLVWAARAKTFKDQIYIFGKQNHRLFNLVGEVEYVITDSPLLLTHIYAPEYTPKSFGAFVNAVNDTYDNINYFINRVKPYVEKGRHQNEAQAREIDVRIKQMLQQERVPFTEVQGDNFAPDVILKNLEFNQWPNLS